MPDDSTKRPRRQYRRRSAREILIDKKEQLEKALEKGRKRVDDDAKGLQQMESERAHSRFPGHALTPTGVMAIRCKQFHLPDL